jgi:S1-C subfamily serine protease
MKVSPNQFLFSMRTQFAVVLVMVGTSLSMPSPGQDALEYLKSIQTLRKDLFNQISPGVVSVELVHSSLPAWELAQIERWSNECRLQPWRSGGISDQEAEQWRDWCDSFLTEIETQMTEGKLGDVGGSAGDWQNFIRQMLSDWQSRERPFLVEGQEASFHKFIALLGEQITVFDTQIAGFKDAPMKPVPLHQNTGFIIDKGLVVTTFDVARHTGPYNHIRVWSDAQVQYSTGEVIGQDPETNVALIQLSSPGAELLPTIHLEKAKSAEIGDISIAFWHAFSQPLSMHMGDVTGVLRKVPTFHCATFLETSFPTSPGTLGAPLISLDGSLLGMSTIFMTQGTMTEVTFALPSEQLLDVVSQLRQNGSVKRAKLGVSVSESVSDDHTSKKVVVKDVEPNSCAARYGVRAGDVIVAVNNEPIHCKTHLIANLSRRKPNEQIVLEVLRAGQSTQIPVDLDPMQ